MSGTLPDQNTNEEISLNELWDQFGNILLFEYMQRSYYGRFNLYLFRG